MGTDSPNVAWNINSRLESGFFRPAEHYILELLKQDEPVKEDLAFKKPQFSPPCSQNPITKFCLE
jgi:hypothetical protein